MAPTVFCLLSLFAAAAASRDRVSYSTLMGDGASTASGSSGPNPAVRRMAPMLDPKPALKSPAPAVSAPPPWHPCNDTSSAADLFYCSSAGTVKLTDCSAIDESGIVAAPYLKTVASFYLSCSLLALYLPVLANVTGVPSVLYSFYIRATLQYVYLFSLHSITTPYIVLGSRPVVFEAPYLQDVTSFHLEIDPSALASPTPLNVSTSVAKPKPQLDPRCDPNLNLSSSQVTALELPCDLGGVNWDSLEPGLDPSLLWEVGSDINGCKASSMRNASFSNVPASVISELYCDHLRYIGDIRTATADTPVPVLRLRNSTLNLWFEHLDILYGGVFLVYSAVQLIAPETVSFRGFRSYMQPPELEPGEKWMISVPNAADPKKLVMRDCELRRPGLFAAFSDETLKCND